MLFSPLDRTRIIEPMSVALNPVTSWRGECLAEII
jgi:hypothetical protein